MSKYGIDRTVILDGNDEILFDNEDVHFDNQTVYTPKGKYVVETMNHNTKFNNFIIQTKRMQQNSVSGGKKHKKFSFNDIKNDETRQQMLNIMTMNPFTDIKLIQNMKTDFKKKYGMEDIVEEDIIYEDLTQDDLQKMRLQTDDQLNDLNKIRKGKKKSSARKSCAQKKFVKKAYGFENVNDFQKFYDQIVGGNCDTYVKNCDCENQLDAEQMQFQFQEENNLYGGAKEESIMNFLFNQFNFQQVPISGGSNILKNELNAFQDKLQFIDMHLDVEPDEEPQAQQEIQSEVQPEDIQPEAQPEHEEQQPEQIQEKMMQNEEPIENVDNDYSEDIESESSSSETSSSETSSSETSSSDSDLL